MGPELSGNPYTSLPFKSDGPREWSLFVFTGSSGVVGGGRVPTIDEEPPVPVVETCTDSNTCRTRGDRRTLYLLLFAHPLEKSDWGGPHFRVKRKTSDRGCSEYKVVKRVAQS